MRQRKTSAKKDRNLHLRHAIESLEPRWLLTAVVLHENDTFQFVDSNGNLERVVVKGNPGSTSATLIGATASANNGVTLTDMPGLLNGVSVNGATATLTDSTAVSIISPIVVTDNSTTPPTTNAAANLLALA